jgi:hypothetical protein
MLGVSLDGFNVFDALVDDIASHALRRTRRASANSRTLGERLGCIVCKQDEILVRNWEETAWAEGPMESVRMDIGAEAQFESPPTARRRLKKPYPASLDQVRIVRNGDTAILEYAEPEVSLTHLQVGSELARMSDQEVLDLHNRILERQQERADSYRHVVVEIPPGRPQIELAGRPEQWVPRGGVLRCVVDEGGTNGEALIRIDDRGLSMHEFGRMLMTWAGWGMRVLLVPDDQLTENPEIEVREPQSGKRMR